MELGEEKYQTSWQGSVTARLAIHKSLPKIQASFEMLSMLNSLNAKCEGHITWLKIILLLKTDAMLTSQYFDLKVLCVI